MKRLRIGSPEAMRLEPPLDESWDMCFGRAREEVEDIGYSSAVAEEKIAAAEWGGIDLPNK